MEPVLLGTYNSVAEANLIKAKLKSAGIEAIVEADTAGSTWPAFESIRGVRVLVRDSDLGEALEVLERMLPAGE
jgi:type III secretory pathway lipoprotein EscJ